MQDQNPISQVIPKRFAAAAPQAPGRMSQAIFTKNHPKPEPPQHMPATRVASEKNRVCHYLSPSILHDLRAIGSLVFTLDALAPRSLGPFFRLLSPSTLLTPRALSEISNLKSEIPPRLVQDSLLAPTKMGILSHVFFLRADLPHPTINLSARATFPPTPVRAPNGAPACSHKCSVVGHRPTSAIRGQRRAENPAPAGAEESLECAQKTTKITNRPNPCPPQELQTKKIACVTICHVRFCTTYARSASWSSPWTPQPLGPSAPFCSPIVTLQNIESPRPIQSPDCQGGVTSRMQSRPAATSSVAALASRSAPCPAAFSYSLQPIAYSLASQAFFSKNHPKPEPPQPLPATIVGTIPQGLVSPYVTWI